MSRVQQIFLSYSHGDADFARRLASELSQKKIKVWWADGKLTPGDNYAAEMGRALEDSHWLVFILSPEACDSELVSRDLQFALFTERFSGHVIAVKAKPTPDEKIPWILNPLTLSAEPRSAKVAARLIADAIKGPVGAKQ